MALQAKRTRRETELKEAAIAEAIKEETIRLNFDVPISLHQRLKVFAAKAGKGHTIRSISIQAITEYLEHHGE